MTSAERFYMRKRERERMFREHFGAQAASWLRIATEIYSYPVYPRWQHPFWRLLDKVSEL